MMLTTDQLETYQRDGYLILRSAIDEAEVLRLERGFARHPPVDGTLDSTKTYPEPGRYTLANNCLKDPDLAFIAEHPTILDAAETLLGDAPRLTAFVIYDRTPGGGSIPAHNDYKRWRPVGSSMNWLFTIVPFSDFDAQTGQLFVAPGSHHLERIKQTNERTLHVDPCIRPDESTFIDPELRRGDLLIMNMHLWHKAAGNTSRQHRVGAFNKYAAANAPPATGYFRYDDDVYAALSSKGKSLLAVHSNKPIATTRLVLVRGTGADVEVLLVKSDDGRFTLPGGRTYDERAIPDWDLGNMIAPLQQHLREDLNIATPWVSYTGDFDEGDHLCRVYGYDLTGLGFPVPYDGRWHKVDELDECKWSYGFEATAVRAWLDPNPVRGKGLSQAQSRVDQYAY